jgi:hypothetical protein
MPYTDGKQRQYIKATDFPARTFAHDFQYLEHEEEGWEEHAYDEGTRDIVNLDMTASAQLSHTSRLLGSTFRQCK